MIKNIFMIPIILSVGYLSIVVTGLYSVYEMFKRF
jgi:hypothetical protein